jgi:hypothetical protein
MKLGVREVSLECVDWVDMDQDCERGSAATSFCKRLRIS